MGVEVVQEREERATLHAVDPRERHRPSRRGRLVAAPSTGPSTAPETPRAPRRGGPGSRRRRPPRPSSVDGVAVLVTCEASIQAGRGIAVPGVGDEPGRWRSRSAARRLGQRGYDSRHRAVLVGRQLVGPSAGEHARVRGERPGGRRSRLLEGTPPRGQLARFGRGVAAVAVEAQVIGPDRVQHDQQDVRRRRVGAAVGMGVRAGLAALDATIRQGTRDHRGDDRQRRPSRSPRAANARASTPTTPRGGRCRTPGRGAATWSLGTHSRMETAAISASRENATRRPRRQRIERSEQHAGRQEDRAGRQRGHPGDVAIHAHGLDEHRQPQHRPRRRASRPRPIR